LTRAATVPADGYTDEQRRAIQTRDVSVSLSAGAGCGKTFVLTERFLSHFKPCDPDALRAEDLGHLIAITFTERAAREMRDRIRGKCYQNLIEAPPDEAPHWAALLRSLDVARISTIHAFCASLLRSRAVEAGLDPSFRVLEQAQSDVLLSEAVEDALRGLIAQRDPASIELAVQFDLRSLSEMLQLLARECTTEQFAEWRQTSPDEQVSLWDAFYRDKVLPAVAAQVYDSPAAREVRAMLAEHLPEHAVMCARRDVLLDKLTAIERSAKDPAALAADFAELRANSKVQGGGSAKVWTSGDVYSRFMKAAGDLRKTIDAANGLLTFDSTAALPAARVAGQLFAIADNAAERYRARKQELKVLDFNDLLARASKLLTDPLHRGLAERVSHQIRLLLVDEFQDTDPLQVELVKALCGQGLTKGKLFFVGDYKQSIYRFRGAKPNVFRDLRDRTPAEGKQSLTLNFRSQPAILQFVNALFWDDLGSGYEPLRASRAQVSPTPAVEFLWAAGSAARRSEARRGNGKEEKSALRRREADWIARRIRALVDGGQPLVFDSEATRNGQPRARAARLADVAILFRALSDVQLYEAALRQYDIDYYVVGGHAFYAQQEIFDVLNLLRAIHDQTDLLSLAGALRSAMFSLTDETIFWLSRHAQGLSGGLFAARYPQEVAADQQSRARFAAETLAQLRGRKDRLRICELVEMALARTGYDAAILHEFMGERKLANLRKLVEQARQFDRGSLFGLGDFITQLAEFVVRQPDEALAATHSENTNVVRLMTIHQSKGLEFPIVIVPDVDRPRLHRAAGVHFDPRLGPLVRLRDAGSKADLGGYELWRFAEKTEEAAELNRLLYVATTRAADYLILSSGVVEAAPEQGPWTQLLARRFDLDTGRFLGTLSPGEACPQVKVTIEEPTVPRMPVLRRPKPDIDQVVAAAMAGATTQAQGRPAIDPVAPDLGGRRQYSFSRLSGALGQSVPQLPALEFGDGAALDARGLGTLVHAVLGSLDFKQASDLPSLVRLHAQRLTVDSATDRAEALQMVERFVGSARARDLGSAAESHAEVEFLLRWPIEGGALPRATICGAIDRLYRDRSGRWHLLDFKTNRVSAATVAAQAAPYEMQMLLYALAAERILQTSPSSVTLHFLRTGSEHAFAWNAEAKSKVIEMVSAGIAATAAGRTT
jgi:ATP-dependent helicase/nuclease subunit A